jgi:DNA recombination protein RmuC
MTNILFIFIALLCGIVFGIIVTYLILRSSIFKAYENGKNEAGLESAALAEKLKGGESRIEEYRRDIAAKDIKINELTEKLSITQIELSKVKTILDKERNMYEEKIMLLNNAKEELSAHFKNLSIDIFDNRNKTFTVQTKSTIEQLLVPFREQIDNFKKQIESARTQDLSERVSLKTEIENLTKLNQQMKEETGNLTKALKGEVKTQGTWGEMILEKVLEKSGLVKGREFEIQESLKSQDGKRYQPDVIVHLPDKRDIVIDSKISLVAYERLVSCDSEEERLQNCKELVASMRAHIKNLSEKDYNKLLGINSLDFVFMFIPIEGAFSAAVQADNMLFSAAFEKNIVMVCPSTMLATLRTIENVWKYENQNRNAREIAKKAGLLYDKFVGFVLDLENIGKGIDNAKKSYDQAFGKLNGKGNLVRIAENIKQMGAATTKKLPDSVLNDDEVEADDESKNNTFSLSFS